MTYTERINNICDTCGQSEVCGYYFHNAQRRCEYLQAFSYGWKLGQEDTIAAVEDYVDRGNSAFTEEFMTGLRESIKE